MWKCRRVVKPKFALDILVYLNSNLELIHDHDSVVFHLIADLQKFIYLISYLILIRLSFN